MMMKREGEKEEEKVVVVEEEKEEEEELKGGKEEEEEVRKETISRQPSKFSTLASTNSLRKYVPVYLNWKDIRYSVTVTIPGRYPWSAQTQFQKPILHGVSGFLRPGEFCAVLGPSGSGKTSLLNVLSTLVTKDKYEGMVLFNGMEHNSSTYDSKRMSGFVQQMEVQLSYLTVEESLMYTARLKLPSGTDHRAVVEAVMEELGILHCRNTRIGDGIRIFGCSGGERKRVSIANELIINPSILFLDEPTTGLDSSISFNLVKTLISLAREGRTIMCTIHQPSSQIFYLFERLLLLADGKVCYHGHAKDLVSYFSSIGFDCPNHFNPADFILFLANEPEKAKILAERFAEVGKDKDIRSVAELHRAYSIHQPPKFVYPTSWAEQVAVLTQRSTKQHFHVVMTWTSFFQFFGIGFAAGAVWFQIDRTEERVFERSAVLFFILTLLAFMSAAPVIVLFPIERMLLQRERFGGAYRLSAYYCSKIFSQSWLSLFFPMMFSFILYWMSGLRVAADAFFVFFFILMLTGITGQAFGVMVVTAIMNIGKALAIAITIMIGMLLFGGFFAQTIPIGVRWFGNLSFMRWAYLALLYNEFSGDSRYTCADPSQFITCPNATISNYQVLESLNVHSVDITQGEAVVILAGMCVFYYFVGYLNLRYGFYKV